MRASSLLSCTLALLALASSGGCVIYEKGGVYGDGPSCDADGPGGDGVADSGDAEDDSGQVGELQSTWTWDPDTLSPGETRIVSVSADPVFDYGTIDDVQIFGDGGICTFEVGQDGLSVVVSAWQDAGEGTLDALLLTDDGGAIWLEDALSIHIPDGSADGGDQGGDEVTGDEGSTSGGTTGACGG